MPLPPDNVSPPSHAELVGDLALWREKGVLRLRQLRLLALGRAALAAGDATTATEATEPAVLIELVRRAISAIAGSITGRCALVLLGLDPQTFDVAPHLLREDAAEIYGVSVARFRRNPQRQVLSVVADGVLEQCFLHRARMTRLSMEQRHPADSRLAVKWLERFESYFDIWTPVYALGADLTAYRSTLLESDRPWERQPGTDRPDDPGYTQEQQASGYGTHALFRLAYVLAAEQQFIARHGGLWLLSSAQAEAEARDSLHAVTRSLPTNERDHSWLRQMFNQATGEIHPFLLKLRQDSLGRTTHDEWQAWLMTCSCVWMDAPQNEAVEYFPTARYYETIEAACRVHQTIEACNRYCTTIEQEWLRVADWYGIAVRSERQR